MFVTKIKTSLLLAVRFFLCFLFLSIFLLNFHSRPAWGDVVGSRVVYQKRTNTFTCVKSNVYAPPYTTLGLNPRREKRLVEFVDDHYSNSPIACTTVVRPRSPPLANDIIMLSGTTSPPTRTVVSVMGCDGQRHAPSTVTRAP